jgi:DNA invertase Pin-like site-specific DNA recombinase
MARKRPGVNKDEGVSGAKGRDQRPGFDALHLAIARREVDVVMAWSVDRLGRSLQDLVGFLGELEAKGVDLYLHVQGLDTSTPAGRAMFGMLSVFSEFERSMIQERVRAGLERARARGTRLGRPPKATPRVRRKVLASRARGHSMRRIARDLGVSPATVHAVVKAGAGQEVA